jgi:hypothetical protein
MELAMQYGQGSIGGNDVNAVRLNVQPILYLQNLQRGVALEQLDQNTFVSGVQVLHNYKSQATITWHMGKELLIGLLPARRRANTDNDQALVR